MQYPLPDELMCSVWLRSVRRAGLPLGVATLELTGRKWYPGFFQGGHLGDIAPFLGKPAEKLLLEHTVFPYSTAFHNEAARAKCLKAALSTGPAARACGGLTQGVSDLVPHRRWCPKCCAEDEEQLGVSYWRRGHNLPGVAVCLRHSEPLMESQVPTRGGKNSSIALPHELRPGRRLCRHASKFLLDVARLSSALLSEQQGICDGTALAYRQKLRELGFLSDGRHIRAEVFLSAVKRGSVQASAFGLDHESRWLPLMLRPGVQAPFVSAKHVFLQTALIHLKATGTPTLDHVSTGRSKRKRAGEDRDFASRLRTTVRTHLREETKTRVSDALIEIGAWGSFRHDRARYPHLSREVERLRDSAASVRPSRRRC